MHIIIKTQIKPYLTNTHVKINMKINYSYIEQNLQECACLLQDLIHFKKCKQIENKGKCLNFFNNKNEFDQNQN